VSSSSSSEIAVRAVGCHDEESKRAVAMTAGRVLFCKLRKRVKVRTMWRRRREVGKVRVRVRKRRAMRGMGSRNEEDRPEQGCFGGLTLWRR
jgi:hypothetical protein